MDETLFLLELEKLAGEGVVVTEEDAILQRSIALRDLLVRSNMKAAIEGDTKAGNMIRAMLDSNDRSVFTSRKLVVDDKNADSNAALAKYAAEIMDKHNVGVTREKSDDDGTYTPNFDLSEMPTVNVSEEICSVDDSDVDLAKIISDGLAKSSPQEDED